MFTLDTVGGGETVTRAGSTRLTILRSQRTCTLHAESDGSIRRGQTAATKCLHNNIPRSRRLKAEVIGWNRGDGSVMEGNNGINSRIRCMPFPRLHFQTKFAGSGIQRPDEKFDPAKLE
jgi:poly-beta-hydroxyalkanoate depolymerase